MFCYSVHALKILIPPPYPSSFDTKASQILFSSIAYNTRIVLTGTLLLGMCGGVVGTFMLLRKKALVGDVASHAALPGIGIAYLLMEAISPGNGKSLPWLLLGAAISAACGIVTANLIQRTRLIKEDAALGIVLSLYFGAGIVLLTIIQVMKSGSAAGLNDFVFGKTAGMTANDVFLIGVTSGVVLFVCLALFKEFAVLCFDEEYAAALGWPARRLDLLLTILVVAVTVIGMQSVGLLLVVALLVIPPTAARFWSDRLGPMVLFASAIGGLSTSIGVMLSASVERLATGPMIVLTSALLFAISMVFGSRRGIGWQLWRHRAAILHKGELDLLRACYEHIERNLLQSTATDSAEIAESKDLTAFPIAPESLVSARSWSRSKVERLLRIAISDGLIRFCSDGNYRLTLSGTRRAAEAVRNHRLWELYLIHFADVALNRVDRDADQIEHILEPMQIEQLEALLKQDRTIAVPASPHG